MPLSLGTREPNFRGKPPLRIGRPVHTLYNKYVCVHGTKYYRFKYISNRSAATIQSDFSERRFSWGFRFRKVVFIAMIIYRVFSTTDTHTPLNCVHGKYFSRRPRLRPESASFSQIKLSYIRRGIAADTYVINRSRYDIASLAENTVVVSHKPRLGRLRSSFVREHNCIATENV